MKHRPPGYISVNYVSSIFLRKHLCLRHLDMVLFIFHLLGINWKVNSTSLPYTFVGILFLKDWVNVWGNSFNLLCLRGTLWNSSFCLRWKELWQLLECGSYMMRFPKVDFCLVSLYFEDLVGESDGQTCNNITAHTYTHSMESLGWVCGVQRRFCGDDTWMSFRGWRGVDQVRTGKGFMGRENLTSETLRGYHHVPYSKCI